MSPKLVKGKPGDRAGRPEFITFDTPEGMSIVFFEHVTGIEGTVERGEGGQVLSHGIRFIFAVASGLRFTEKLGMDARRVHQVISYLITRHLMLGPIVKGRFVDIDSIVQQLEQHDRQQEAIKASRLLGPDGAPVSSDDDGPKLVTLEEAAAEGESA